MQENPLASVESKMRKSLRDFGTVMYRKRGTK